MLNYAILQFFYVQYPHMPGAMIPLALKGIRLDPAVASAPLIASLMDVLSAIIFFSTATTIFHYYW